MSTVDPIAGPLPTQACSPRPPHVSSAAHQRWSSHRGEQLYGVSSSFSLIHRQRLHAFQHRLTSHHQQQHRDLVWAGRRRRQGPGQCPPRPWKEGTYCIQNEQKIKKQWLTNRASNFFYREIECLAQTRAEHNLLTGNIYKLMQVCRNFAIYSIN